MKETFTPIPNSIFVVVPVYNDWESCQLLVAAILLKNEPSFTDRIVFVWVNDGSSQTLPSELLRLGKHDFFIDLTRNVGHQKAIALGISYVASEFRGYSIIVMDADGEDQPQHLSLLAKAGESNSKIVFARRTKRHEGPVFQLFYQIYKMVFRILTGKSIAFGNFSFIPAQQVLHVAHVSEIWNHYSGGIIKSRIPYTNIPLERGKRLAGESKMNFSSLVLHGLSAVAVHSDTMAVRLLLFCAGLVGLSICSIGVVAFIKFFTPFASPGWATTVVSTFTSLIMQSFLVSLLLLFLVLMYRTQRLFIPAKDFGDYVLKVTRG